MNYLVHFLRDLDLGVILEIFLELVVQVHHERLRRLLILIDEALEVGYWILPVLSDDDVVDIVEHFVFHCAHLRRQERRLVACRQPQPRPRMRRCVREADRVVALAGMWSIAP